MGRSDLMTTSWVEGAWRVACIRLRIERLVGRVEDWLCDVHSELRSRLDCWFVLPVFGKRD